jgi:methionine aminopeptidase
VGEPSKEAILVVETARRCLELGIAEVKHGKRMKAGMVFTIEPMINIGGYQTEVMDDEWTVLTMDRSLSAQFEHTVLVTRDGAEVLTARKNVVVHSDHKPWTDVGPPSSPADWNAKQEKTG